MNDATLARAGNGKFRSRKLDFTKPLRIFRYSDLGHEEIDELFAMSRTVPIVATGVDKEEEKEHHLIEALTAHTHGMKVTIPVPEASTEIDDYATLYKANYRMPKYYIKCISKIEERISVPYNITEEDCEWLMKENSLKKNSTLNEIQFETMIYYLELNFSKSNFDTMSIPYVDSLYDIPFASESGLTLPIYTEFISDVFTYWKSLKISNTPLIPTIKVDEYAISLTSKTSSSSVGDPYLCFRRREVKSQRKTRKSESICIDKLRKLKIELERILVLLEMISKRDKYKKESLILDSLIFDKILLFETWKQKYNVKPNARLPSIKALSDAYGYSTGILIKEPKSASFMFDGNSIGSLGSSSSLPLTKITIPTSLFKTNRNFIEFKEKYLRSHSSIFSDFFLSTISSIPLDKHALQSARHADKSLHCREIIRKLFNEMERKANSEKSYVDKSLFHSHPEPLSYAFRAGRSRMIHEGPCVDSPGISITPNPTKLFPAQFSSMNTKVLNNQDVLNLGNPCVYNLNSHYISSSSATSHRSFMSNFHAASNSSSTSFPMVQPPFTNVTHYSTLSLSNSFNGNNSGSASSDYLSHKNSSSPSMGIKNASSEEMLKSSSISSSRQPFIEIESNSMPNISVKKRKKDSFSTVPT